MLKEATIRIKSFSVNKPNIRGSKICKGNKNCKGNKSCKGSSKNNNF